MSCHVVPRITPCSPRRLLSTALPGRSYYLHFVAQRAGSEGSGTPSCPQPAHQQAACVRAQGRTEALTEGQPWGAYTLRVPAPGSAPGPGGSRPALQQRPPKPGCRAAPVRPQASGDPCWSHQHYPVVQRPSTNETAPVLPVCEPWRAVSPPSSFSLICHPRGRYRCQC